MIPKTFVFLIIYQNVFCYPQSLTLPNIKDSVHPFEVNSLEQHNHQTRSIAKPPDIFSLNNVEETIKEVEAMLKANPTLPRLTRGEILDLLENITKTDMANSKVVNKNENTKERDPKAIMVVMPYTPSNENDNNMQELFTKPPVTHIVGSEPFKKKEDYTFKRIPQEISSIPELANSKRLNGRGETTVAKSFSTTTTPTTAVPSQSSTKRTVSRRRRPPALATATPAPTTYHPTRRPLRRRPTTTERYPNHKYPDEASPESEIPVTAIPSNGIKIIEAPKLTSSESNEDLQMQENRQPTMYSGQVQTESYNKVTEEDIVYDANSKKQTSTGSPLLDLVPDNLKNIVTDLNFQTRKPSKPTTTTTIKTPSEKEEEERIRNMLASFGVLPIKTTSTTTAIPDISNVADNLTPEMRDLLMSFGLISDSQQKKPVSSTPATEVYGFNPVKAEVSPEDYVGFKPLPSDDASRDDMEDLLARFGLGRNSRKEKSLPKKVEENVKKSDSENLSFEAVPEQYMDVLENIGLTDREGKMIRSAPLAKTQEKQHVFNPGEPQYASNEELEKLNKLIEVVRQLESLNGTVTDEDLKKIDMDSLKELISSLNEENKIISLDEQNAPNPVNFDPGLEKNEVKRQENATTTTTPSPSTTTAEAQTANLKDLEASFGGQVDASPATEAPAVETTTAARKTGFYYLVDWNTFLDIDDQKGKRVNLRFQPTVGDPKRFYSVSVP